MNIVTVLPVGDNATKRHFGFLSVQSLSILAQADSSLRIPGEI